MVIAAVGVKVQRQNFIHNMLDREGNRCNTIKLIDEWLLVIV